MFQGMSFRETYDMLLRCGKNEAPTSFTIENESAHQSPPSKK